MEEYYSHTDRKAFGDFVKNKREELGLSQEALAKMIKGRHKSRISVSYLRDVEDGHRYPPPSHLMEQFAVCLATHRDYLYYLAGRIPSDVRFPLVSEADAVEAYRVLRSMVGRKSTMSVSITEEIVTNG